MVSKTNKLRVAMFGAAALALGVSATSQAATVSLPNGDFENGGAEWGVFVAPESAISYEATGGNGGGYGLVSAGTGWGGGFVAGDTPTGLALADYGLSGGDSVTFSFDMIDFDLTDNGCCTGIKLESWANGAVITDTGDLDYVATNTDWNTYTANYTFEAAATHFKVVLVGTNSGDIGFDNLTMSGDNVNPVPIPAAVWLFGSALAGLAGVRRRRK